MAQDDIRTADDTEQVKGPDEGQWGDVARAERGADLTDEQVREHIKSEIADDVIEKRLAERKTAIKEAKSK